MTRMRAAALAIVAAALPVPLAACGSLGLENQVIVHLDEDPNDLVAAQRVADETCRRRGGRARFLVKLYNFSGNREGGMPLNPDAVFVCDPAT